MSTLDKHIISKRSLQLSLQLIPVIIAFEMTDVKIGPVKIGELFFLLYVFFCLITHTLKFRKIQTLFVVFFSIFFVITLLRNSFFRFDTSVADSFIKGPYWASFGRYLEYIACISFSLYISRLFDKYNWDSIISKLLLFNVIIILFLSLIDIIYRLTSVNITPGLNLFLESGRLTGFYIEGGPFGNFIAFLYMINYLFNNNKNKYVYTVIFIIGIILAESKAALSAIVLFHLILLFIQFYHKKWMKPMLIVFLLAGGLIFYRAFSTIGQQYLELYSNKDLLVYQILHSSDEDYSLLAGRVPGFFIFQEMFKDQPFLGIGLGNYPLLRNLAGYRLFFPSIPIYDAIGLGAIPNIINEMGLIGLSFFSYLVFRIWEKTKNIQLIIVFLFPMIFGVQLTFLYPWFILGIAETKKYIIRKHK